ncbi:hypothetical protein BTO06_04315 [Tenacibaculum sp. SZ-18]|uniref:hypothetical protein n=1 Tax=Tenacibaculum sp. SZ-18 TaxID=754423 RepID=UPI000C2D6871|nr:hypothetical protein [Tenacibaculum sp. SZ-18]AUC14416.1 hypothetical protein BTO06_04315 [Tenacibaculum sp. SZ-18]
MNLYSKILSARYYYVSKTNWRHPYIATISLISIFHSLNIFSLLRLLGFNLLDLTQEYFSILIIGTVVIIFLIHELFLMKRKSLDDRLELIEKINLRNYDYLHLMYELITMMFLFYAFAIAWVNYFFVVLFLVGINLNHHSLISIKDEMK